MKFIVDNKHREFFSKNGWIEIEQLISQDKVYELRHAAVDVLGHRLNITPDRVSRFGRGDIVLKGRDLWRDSEVIKTSVCNRVFAEIASNLVEATPIRLAYDQAFISPAADLSVAKDTAVPLLSIVDSLQDISCVQGLLCGLLLTLQRGKHGDEPPQVGIPGTCVPSNVEGNGVFLAPETRINFPKLLETPGETYLLIGYCRAVTRYVLSPGDPNTHCLKNYGYSFGDRLVDEHHPVLYR